MSFGFVVLLRRRTVPCLAEQLGIKPDSMRMRYTRAKRKVAKALLAKGFSPEDLF